MSTINGSRLKILAMLFLFVPQESWDLQLRMFGYITGGFPRIFDYVLQVIKYSIPVPLDRGGFGGWNIMLTMLTITNSTLVDLLFTVLSSIVTFLTSTSCSSNYQSRAPRPLRKSCIWWLSKIWRNLVSFFFTWLKWWDRVLHSECIPSIPCSP